MYDLLHDPLIGTQTSKGVTFKGVTFLSLPELFAALSQGEIQGYTGIRAHQEDPWHVFLVQIAASIQARRPTDTLPGDAAYWYEGLRDLAEGLDTAWQLLVEDVTQPAFLQHPWGNRDESGNYREKAFTPDELDVLATSKNHDVKMAQMQSQSIDAWLYALLTLQTTSGFFGAGNYGILRMNGGFASRSIVSWTPSLHPSKRFQDETRCIQTMRDQIIQDFHYASNGVVLTWIHGWDRKSHQFQITEIEPWFIEAARPIRLQQPASGSIVALGANSDARQIGPKSVENGDVGDPWTPINIADKKKGRSAMTLTSSSGFTPDRIISLLFEQGFECTAMQKPRPGQEPGWFSASCLVRGQGTTEGFHHIAMPIPAKAKLALLKKEHKDNLAELAQHLLTDAKEIQKIIYTALTSLVEGGPETVNFDHDAIKRWLVAERKIFFNHWEPLYFPMLWRGVDENHELVRDDWQQTLIAMAKERVRKAQERLPIPSNRNWRSMTKSHDIFHALLRKKQFISEIKGATHG